MNRLISSALLLILLFNSAGYYFGYIVLRYHAHLELSHHLDLDDYRDAETVTVKVPLTVPYYADSKEYERVNGAFEYKGEFFKLVKQKLERDTLYIVCIKDVRERGLFAIMADFAKLSTEGLATSTPLKLMGSLIREYVPSLPAAAQGHEGWCLPTVFFSMPFECLDKHVYRFDPPPDDLV
jgi:hypothetical protein